MLPPKGPIKPLTPLAEPSLEVFAKIKQTKTKDVGIDVVQFPSYDLVPSHNSANSYDNEEIYSAPPDFVADFSKVSFLIQMYFRYLMTLKILIGVMNRTLIFKYVKTWAQEDLQQTLFIYFNFVSSLFFRIILTDHTFLIQNVSTTCLLYSVPPLP